MAETGLSRPNAGQGGRLILLKRLLIASQCAQGKMRAVQKTGNNSPNARRGKQDAN